MKVYRVETSKGIGPYTAEWHDLDVDCTDSDDWDKFQWHCLEAAALSNKRNPHPYSDGIRGNTEDHYCGFKAQHQVRIWFGGLIQPLINTWGFQVAEYEVSVDHVMFGRRQVMFTKDLAVRTRIINRKQDDAD